MKKLLILCALSALCACGRTNVPEPELLFSLSDYPELEHIKNMQGCAVSGDYFFSLQDKGWCNVFDLRKRKSISQFPLGSAGKYNHANVAFFGPDKYDSSDRFPLIYISQCKEKPVEEIGLAETDSLGRLLFVERILADENGVPFGSELVQLVHYAPKEWNSRLWIADAAHPDKIYCYGNTVGNEKPLNHIVIKSFDFPRFSSDRFLVSLTDEDVLESFNFDELLPEGHRGPQNAILQGAFLKDGVLFLPCGVGTEEHPNELFYADLSGHKYGYFDFTSSMPCEPEDFDLWEDKLICPANSDGVGKVYSFPYRELLKAMVKK
ncbi:MAG: hypothetical protein II475_02045 [Bacteroidales bacterium]|nr:hypothetical protein [Bacteroidales bacterium]